MILVLLLGFVPPKYPRVVHNKCIGKYAIQISVDTYFGRWPWMRASYTNTLIEQMDSTFYGRKLKYFYEYGWVSLGQEVQFDDSLSAVNTYKEYIDEEKWINYVDERDQKRRDSVYKCQHTYQ